MKRVNAAQDSVEESKAGKQPQDYSFVAAVVHDGVHRPDVCDPTEELRGEMRDLRAELAQVRLLLQQLLRDPDKEPGKGWRWHLYSRADLVAENAQLLEDFLRKMIGEEKIRGDQRIKLGYVRDGQQAHWVALRIESAGGQKEFFSEACAHFRQYSRDELRTTQDGLKLAAKEAAVTNESSYNAAAAGQIRELARQASQL